MPIAVRRVTADDWPAMKRVRLLALETDRLAFGATLEEEAAFPDQVWIDRARASAAGSDVATWIAEDQASGQTVGMMGAQVGPNGARLFGTWVDPRVRGAGVGGRLLDALLGWIAGVAPGAPVGLCVNPAFQAAVRLYQSRGFVRRGCSTPIAHASDLPTDEMVLTPAR
jgi:ribosomal protein S18 acetylase RimI-like enzyme